MKKKQSLKKTLFMRIIFPLLFTFSAIFFVGCDDNNRILDPTQTGRFRSVPAVSVILDTLGVEEEIPPAG